MTEEFYRPVNIEFKVTPDETGMPAHLGTFKTAEEAGKHMASNFTCMNRQQTAVRYMDAVEKEMKRTEYRNTLEDILPVFEKDLLLADNQLTEAKKKAKDALEAYNVTMNHAKQLAYEVKKGTKEMELDEKYTYRVPYKGRYYFYTWIDSELRLCKILDIPEWEKADLWNAMAGNEAFIEHLAVQAKEIDEIFPPEPDQALKETTKKKKGTKG